MIYLLPSALGVDKHFVLVTSSSDSGLPFIFESMLRYLSVGG